MSIQTEESKIEQLITAYAEAVNKAKYETISAFYTEDGVLIPEGYNPLPQGRRSGSYFTKSGLDIHFSIKEITVEGGVALVQAKAEAKLKRSPETTKITRDLFFLKNIEGSWKIYRYIFNS